MSNAANQNVDAIALSGLADAEHHGVHDHDSKGHLDVNKEIADPYVTTDDDDEWPDKPTDEERQTLRRVSGKIPWTMYTIAFAELAERFSYYGSSVLYTNFVNNPLPMGSNTGSDPSENGKPGALGMGTKAAQGISLFNQFFAYITPLLGAWIADSKLGRFNTIMIAIVVGMVAHAILVASGAPDVIIHKDSCFAAFIIGLMTLGLGTGLFKANVSPLLAEQNQDSRMRVETLPSGERVIVDPAITNTRVFLWFYFLINTGSLTGQIGMVYVEKYHSFWLAWFLPTVLFLVAPAVLYSNKKKYRMSPPTGSLLSKFLKMWWFTRKRSPSAFKFDWNQAKPSAIPVAERPSWMTYDDAWVDEVRRGLLACKVFLFLPIFFLAYNQMTGNLTTQANTMQLHGVPNDILQNLNPISIVIMIPIIDHGLYPFLRKMGIAFTPIKRMTWGFGMSCASMVAAAVMQHYIYKMSPCGDHPNGCDEPAPINVWAQSLPYILVGLSEIFTNVTSYEYAFSKAPENMKSLVMSINLFMSAVSSAIGQAFTPMSEDPLLVWNYVCVALIAFIGGVAFWFCFHHLDGEEDKLNMLKKSEFIGQNKPTETAESKALEA